MSRIKTKHVISDHHYKFGEREKNISIVSFFIDLNDFIRSDKLVKL